MCAKVQKIIENLLLRTDIFEKTEILLQISPPISVNNRKQLISLRLIKKVSLQSWRIERRNCGMVFSFSVAEDVRNCVSCMNIGNHRTILEGKFDLMKMSSLIRLLIFLGIWVNSDVIA